jgi:hypothetical protein
MDGKKYLTMYIVIFVDANNKKISEKIWMISKNFYHRIFKIISNFYHSTR